MAWKGSGWLSDPSSTMEHMFDASEAREREARAAAEREACAKVCESFTTQNDYDRNDACELISDAIRARGKP